MDIDEKLVLEISSLEGMLEYLVIYTEKKETLPVVIRIIGDIIASNDQTTAEMLLDMKFDIISIPSLKQTGLNETVNVIDILNHYLLEKLLTKDILWTLTNTIYSGQKYAMKVLECPGLLQKVIKVLKNFIMYNVDCQIEALNLIKALCEYTLANSI